MTVVVPAGLAPGAIFTVEIPSTASQQPPVQPLSNQQQVLVPPGAQPGQTMMVNLGNGQQMTVIVPTGVAPGGTFTVEIPAAPPTTVQQQLPVELLSNQQQVVVPPGAQTGQTIMATLGNGQQMMVQIPAGVAPGGTFTVQIPATSSTGQALAYDQGQLMHRKGACCGLCPVICPGEEHEIITFEEHMERMKNKEFLHAAARKLHLSERGRLFKYTVNVLESNPFFGIFFHEKGGAFNTKEQVAIHCTHYTLTRWLH
jgi:hypothetical protein